MKPETLLFSALSAAAGVGLALPAHAQEAPAQEAAHAQEAPLQEATPAEDAAPNCAESYEKAQTDRASGEYLSALESARACSQYQCSAAIIRECIKLYDAIEGNVPSLVFAAKGVDGSALVNVRVTMDGKPLLDHLDGKPVYLNPRAYLFRFEADGLPPVETYQTARVGDKNRLIEVVLGTPAARAEPAPDESTPAGESPAPVVRKRPVPVMSYVLGGVGVVALGTFGYLRLSGIADYNDLNASCSPTCNPKDLEPIETKFRMSFVALGVGAAAFGGAAALYFLRGEESVSPSAEIGVSTGLGMASAHLKARF